MEMRQLLQVMEVYKTHSISKAAQNLYISQPTLTVSIRQLEEELGEQLFVRSRRGTETTPFGRRFVQYIAPVCSQFSALDAAIADLRRRSSKELMISVPPVDICCRAYASVLKKHCGGALDARLRECFAGTAITDVEQGHSEIAVVAVVSAEMPLFSHLLPLKGLEYSGFLCTPPAISVSPSHPLAQRSSVTAGDLQGYTQMIYSDNAGDSLFEDALHIGGKIDKIYVNSRAGLAELMQETGAFGVTALRLGRPGTEDPDTRIIPLTGTGIEVHIGWVRRSGRTLGQLAEEYIACLRALLDVDEPEETP